MMIMSISIISCDEKDTTTNTSNTETTQTTLETTESFVISFDTKGGIEINSIEVLANSDVNLPESTKEGYTFLGWTLVDSIEALVIDEPFQIDSSITLYAKWSVNQYTISFNTDGGSSIEPITHDYGTTVTQPTNPTKEGFIFVGWYIDDEFTTLYEFSTIPSNDLTIYAKWEAEDWTDIEGYLENVIPLELSSSISLPTIYNEYTISWSTSNSDVLNDQGEYKRPYQPTVVSLTAVIEVENRALTKIYEINIEGYKSLAAPIASSYIYRNYSLVNDSFFDTLDIINCAFITANSVGTLSGTTVLANINTYIMPKAKENGNWVIFSIAPDSDWTSIIANSTRMNTFADNIVNMINTYGFDGVDIDWETPTDDQATKFTDLMRIVYTKVKENNPNHLVTAAIPGGMWQPPRYDLTNSHQYIDYINMMTYGMVSNNGYYQNALYRSTTYANPTNIVGKTLTSCSIEESIQIYHTYGIPNNKIIVGAAFYGIKQTRTYDASTQTWSSWINAGSVSYTNIISTYLNNSNYNYYYDSKAGVPYIISTDGKTFISYDNARSIADKSEYIIDNGLAGMMYWENGLDTTGTLLLAMQVGLKELD
jgi:chitinase